MQWSLRNAWKQRDLEVGHCNPNESCWQGVTWTDVRRRIYWTGYFFQNATCWGSSIRLKAGQFAPLKFRWPIVCQECMTYWRWLCKAAKTLCNLQHIEVRKTHRWTSQRFINWSNVFTVLLRYCVEPVMYTNETYKWSLLMTPRPSRRWSSLMTRANRPSFRLSKQWRTVELSRHLTSLMKKTYFSAILWLCNTKTSSHLPEEI
jgi:hypothetical protein